MTKNEDTVQPKDKWEFDESVAACFDDMLARSIPQYDVMRKTCFDLACEFIKPGLSWILDLGSSRGESVARLVDKYGVGAHFVLAEVSEPMIAVLRERFKGYISSNIVSLWTQDIKKEFPHPPATLIQSILTLQFTPINYRQALIQNCYDTLQKGGAFILVEKVLGGNASMDALLVKHYHVLKHINGYSYEDIDRKAASLEGVLVPVTAEWNVDMLNRAGFRHVECFWRFLNFAGFIAVKD